MLRALVAVHLGIGRIPSLGKALEHGKVGSADRTTDVGIPERLLQTLDQVVDGARLCIGQSDSELVSGQP
ncbi:hypothetical protein M2405_000507 [Rhodococcus erythropolis]|uniref:hypothetical protein n=1 Tax=Rhodococcus erythropolis TaxID=1833 RepID=UPI0021685ECE|nr:hypothetical protein [Rhodococcus erythropolis]MCS4252236.1 hypothetical protein [Rhodococcus erythropolis]